MTAKSFAVINHSLLGNAPSGYCLVQLTIDLNGEQVLIQAEKNPSTGGVFKGWHRVDPQTKLIVGDACVPVQFKCLAAAVAAIFDHVENPG